MQTREAEPQTQDRDELERQREDILTQLTDWLEPAMLLLAFVWLGLLIVEFVWGESRLLNTASLSIWAVFVLDFGLRFFVAPRKLRFLASNWLTVCSLLIPALRVFRIVRVVRLFRLARAARSLRLVRVLSSINRGMRALGGTMRRRGLGYVLLLTLVVEFAGAAGMYAFEKDRANGGLQSYPNALWWTAMILTTMGSERWPETPEGRVLCLILATYAFTIFGYITASLASFFVGRDAHSEQTELGGVKGLARLEQELVSIREEVRKLTDIPRKSAAEAPIPPQRSSPSA